MKLNSILLVIFLIVLSVFTYTRSNELIEAKKEVENLNFKIEEQEKTIEKLNYHYQMEYEYRNILDIKARSIYDALKNLNLDYLKGEVAVGVTVENDKIVFEDGNICKLFRSDYDYILRQRYYVLSDNELSFETGYEIISENVDSITVCIMEFKYQGDEWKLSNIYFDV